MVGKIIVTVGKKIIKAGITNTSKKLAGGVAKKKMSETVLEIAKDTAVDTLIDATGPAAPIIKMARKVKTIEKEKRKDFIKNTIKDGAKDAAKSKIKKVATAPIKEITAPINDITAPIEEIKKPIKAIQKTNRKINNSIDKVNNEVDKIKKGRESRREKAEDYFNKYDDYKLELEKNKLFINEKYDTRINELRNKKRFTDNDLKKIKMLTSKPNVNDKILFNKSDLSLLDNDEIKPKIKSNAKKEYIKQFEILMKNAKSSNKVLFFKDFLEENKTVKRRIEKRYFEDKGVKVDANIIISYEKGYKYLDEKDYKSLLNTYIKSDTIDKELVNMKFNSAGMIHTQDQVLDYRMEVASKAHNTLKDRLISASLFNGGDGKVDDEEVDALQEIFKLDEWQILKSNHAYEDSDYVALLKAGRILNKTKNSKKIDDKKKYRDLLHFIKNNYSLTTAIGNWEKIYGEIRL